MSTRQYNISEFSQLSKAHIKKLTKILAKNTTPAKKWCEITQEILTPDIPFETHQKIFSMVYVGQTEKYMWLPSKQDKNASYIGEFMRSINAENVSDFHQWSMENTELFWQKIVMDLEIPFKQRPQKTVDLAKGVKTPNWLPGASFNIVDACLQANPEKTAIVFANEFGVMSSWNYHKLTQITNQVSNGLVELGVKAGESIAIDMLMTAESVAVYLGIIKMGAVVVSIADSFVSQEIKIRLEISKSKFVITQDYIDRAGKKLPLYEKVCKANPEKVICIMHENTETILRAGDISWDDFLSKNTNFESIDSSADTAMNIIFSSGTTGSPKAIPWVHSTPIKCASDARFYQNIDSSSIFAWPTNLGWMMGPYLVFGTLMNQATMALFYGTPNTHNFVKFIEDAQVTNLGVIPSIVKTWRANKTLDNINWNAIKTFSSTAENSNWVDMLYLSSKAGYKPVIEYCGGTEIGGGYISSTVVQPNIPGIFTTPAFGIGVELISEDGSLLTGESQGEIALIPPSMGLADRILNFDHYETYYKGMPIHHGQSFRRHGDQMQRLANGYFLSLGRADDAMNLGGIKTSSAKIEQVVNTLQSVYESAAIAVSPPDNGPSLLVIYCVSADRSDDGMLIRAAQKAVREDLNPLFKIHDLVVIDQLPRTASNKIMRRILRQRYIQSVASQIPATF